MACLDFEGAVISPQINRSSDTCDSTFKNLNEVSNFVFTVLFSLPFRLLLCRRSRIRGRHISSSIQITTETLRGIYRTHLGSLRLPEGWSFCSIRPPVSQQREPASPNSRNCRYFRAAREDCQYRLNKKRTWRWYRLTTSALSFLISADSSSVPP